MLASRGFCLLNTKRKDIRACGHGDQTETGPESAANQVHEADSESILS